MSEENSISSVENEWFEHNGWDEMGTAWFQYYDVTVKKPFAGLSEGEQVSTLSLDYDNASYVIFGDEDEVLKEGKFRIVFD